MYHNPGLIEQLPEESLFSCKLRYIVRFGLVEMAISTNPNLKIYMYVINRVIFIWPWVVIQVAIHISRSNENQKYIRVEKIHFNPFKPDFTLSSSSTTSRELLSQFSTCSGWRWLESGGKWTKYIVIIIKNSWKFSHSSEMQNDASMHREGLKG